MYDVGWFQLIKERNEVQNLLLVDFQKNHQELDGTPHLYGMFSPLFYINLSSKYIVGLCHLEVRSGEGQD